MSSSTAYVDNIKDFDEDKEMEELANEFNFVRLGKKLRKTNKLVKELDISDKPTHKKSKGFNKWD
jgi:hypothetical protein